MTKPTTITGAIEQVAIDGIQKMKVGQTEVDVKSVDELIQADKYVKANDATEQSSFGIRKRRIVPRYR
jgi:hypothetical protein